MILQQKVEIRDSHTSSEKASVNTKRQGKLPTQSKTNTTCRRLEKNNSQGYQSPNIIYFNLSLIL